MIQGKSVRSPLPVEDGAAETTWDELPATPTPNPPAAPEGRRMRKLGVKLNLRKEAWRKGGLFIIRILFFVILL